MFGIDVLEDKLVYSRYSNNLWEGFNIDDIIRAHKLFNRFNVLREQKDNDISFIAWELVKLVDPNDLSSIDEQTENCISSNISNCSCKVFYDASAKCYFLRVSNIECNKHWPIYITSKVVKILRMCTDTKNSSDTDTCL